MVSKKDFDSGVFKISLAAKSERKCIKFVVSLFLIVIGNIITNFDKLGKSFSSVKQFG